ncbi:UNVERIFIED_CONTAM: hypothetical protein Scaly_1606100 [Sesamum calycinum]|uniref:DUF4218 domain-containing protein n=1 Tax=Sesamum calycinum TaxID=2727403 RepID=A0AAW2P813_9LAMI
MPKAAYTLTKKQKKKKCEWVRCLRFPDGYASNLTICVDIANLRLHGMKSNNCHIFMHKLISIAFREKIFPPTFLDSMEHLIVHLPYKARVVGPMQYKWMYPFERFLRDLKKKVKTKHMLRFRFVRHTLFRKLDGSLLTILNLMLLASDVDLAEMMS